MGVSLLAPACIVVRYAGMHFDIYQYSFCTKHFLNSDSSDDNDEELANIAEGLTPVDISDESDEEI